MHQNCSSNSTNTISASKLTLFQRAGETGNTLLMWKAIIYDRASCTLPRYTLADALITFLETLPTNADTEVLVSKHFKVVFQRRYIVRARARLQSTANSLLHIRYYWLCLLSFTTFVTHSFLFYISRLSLHLLLDSLKRTVWGYGLPKICMMDLMLETCYTLCSFEALFSPAVFGWVSDLSATTRKIWMVNKLKVV